MQERQQSLISERNQIPKRQLELRYELQKEAIKRSPYLLGKYVLGFDKFCSTQIKWDKWARQHIDYYCKRQTRNLIMQPRGVFKTSFFVVTQTINILLCNPNASILIISSTSGTASDILRSIKSILKNNEKLKSLYGEFETDCWNNTELIIKQRTNLSAKEPSVTCMGKGATIVGKHYDVIFPDDLVSDNDRDSAAERKATQLYFEGLFDIVKRQTGQVIITGTRWHMQDMYNHILSNKSLSDKFNKLITPAIAEDGSLNFPELLTKEILDDLRIVKQGKDALDNSSFESQYQLRPISASEQIFKIFHYYDHATTSYECFIMYTDPALSSKTTACYSAIIILGLINEGLYKGRWGVAYGSIEKRNPSKLMSDVIRIHKTFSEIKETACIMENNGFQSLLVDNTIKQALTDGYNLPISGKTNTKNKDMRIAAIEPYLSQAHLLIRNDWRDAPEGYKIIMEQLTEFPQGLKDAVDALAGAHEISKGRYYTLGSPETP